jgi:signal transduction histidine kinase
VSPVDEAGEVRRAQHLEAVGRLAAGIAHEINTPIQFIGDNVRFLEEAFTSCLRLLAEYRHALETDRGEVPWAERQLWLGNCESAADLAYFETEVPQAIEHVLEGIGRVASIVQAMKSFGHPDGISQEPADINDCVANTVVVARNEYKYVAQVVTDLGELPLVVCFPGDLKQVLLNLVVNAAHAIAERLPEGAPGHIMIATKTEHDDVLITVADNGSGIPANIASKVFDPFFTTKEVGKGTGQGLALARAVIEDRHGGTIRFTSPPGGGTTFTLRIPIAGKTRGRG